MIILLTGLVLNYGAAIALTGLIVMGFLMIFGHAMFALSTWLIVRIFRGREAAASAFEGRYM